MSEVSDLRARLERSQAHVLGLQAEIITLEGEIARLEAEDLQPLVDRLLAQIATIKELVARLVQDIENLDA